MPKLSTRRMHDPGSIVPHIRPKVFINNQMSWIKYNYYINNISKQVQEIIDMQKGNNKVNKA
jgi:hypothetical protein